jgi:hypothetical protein
MSLSGPILAEFMTGTYERSRAADKRTYEGRIFFARSKTLAKVPNAPCSVVSALGGELAGHCPPFPPTVMAARPVPCEDCEKNLCVLVELFPATRKCASDHVHLNQACSTIHEVEVEHLRHSIWRKENGTVTSQRVRTVTHAIPPTFAAQLLAFWPTGKPKPAKTAKL